MFVILYIYILLLLVLLFDITYILSFFFFTYISSFLFVFRCLYLFTRISVKISKFVLIFREHLQKYFYLRLYIFIDNNLAYILKTQNSIVFPDFFLILYLTEINLVSHILCVNRQTSQPLETKHFISLNLYVETNLYTNTIV